MTSSIMHSCDESDDSLRIISVEVEMYLYPVREYWNPSTQPPESTLGGVVICNMCCMYLQTSNPKEV
jgi:hypothetical protein